MNNRLARLRRVRHVSRHGGCRHAPNYRATTKRSCVWRRILKRLLEVRVRVASARPSITRAPLDPLLPSFWSAGNPRLTSSVPLSAAAPRAELPPEQRKGLPGRGASTSARPPLPTAKVALAQDDGDVSGMYANSSCRCARDRRCHEGRACAGQGTNL